MSSAADARDLVLAGDLLDAGQPARALPLLHSHLASFPDHAEAHTRLAQAHVLLGSYMPAREAAERAVSLDPDAEFAHRLLAISWARLGYRKLAVDAAETSQRLAPELWLTHGTRADIDIVAGEFSWNGYTAVSRVLELEPDLVDAHTKAAAYLLATRTVLERDAAEVRRHIDTALGIDPQNARALGLLSLLESSAVGRSVQALMPTLAMIEINPMGSANRVAVLQIAAAHVRLLAWIYFVLFVFVFTAVVEPELLDYGITTVVAAVIALASTVGYALLTVRSLGRHALTLLRLVLRLSNLLPLRLLVMALSLVALLTNPAVSPEVTEWTAFFLPALLLVTGVAAYLDTFGAQPRVALWRRLAR